MLQKCEFEKKNLKINAKFVEDISMSSIICFLNIIICLAITYYYFFILNIILKNKKQNKNQQQMYY